MATAARPDRPVAGVSYPRDLGEFLDWFQTDGDCWNYLVRLHWPDGFRCPACGWDDGWLTKRLLYVCASCQHQTSVTAGTIFR